MARGVPDERMFDDPSLVGKVKCIIEGHKEPATGWPGYDGRVIASSGRTYV